MPSKKILFLFVLSIIAVGALFYLTKRENVVRYNQQESRSQVSTLDPDTDGDGLSDWEEVIWKLDAKNPDTDGDGVGDKLEAEQQKLSTSDNFPLFNKDQQESKVTNLTETDKLTREMVYEFLKARAGGTVDRNYIEDLSNRATNNIFYQPTSYKIISPDDLKKIPGNSTPQLIANYGNNMILALRENPIFPGSEFTLVGVESIEDIAFQNWASKLSAFYSKAANNFAKISIPQEFLGLHLILVNDLIKISEEFKAVASNTDDPVVAMSALSRVNTHITEMTSTIETMKTVGESRGIIFSNELGLYIVKSQ